MRAYEQENGREEADGLTACCEHGLPAMCQCKKCDESERGVKPPPKQPLPLQRTRSNNGVEADAEHSTARKTNDHG